MGPIQGRNGQAQITPTPENYKDFVDTVKQVSRRFKLSKYRQHYQDDPFPEETIIAGEMLMATIAEGRREKWTTLMEALGVHFNRDPTSAPLYFSKFTAN